MNVLVTGATGFLGGELTRALVHNLKRIEDETLQQRFIVKNVKAVGRNVQKGAELSEIGAEFIELDLTNTKKVIETFKDVNVVFHCAAKCDIWGDYQDFYQNNVVATENVIEGCLQNNVGRLVYISTPSIYATFQDRFGVRESDDLPATQLTFYSATKLIAEKRIDDAVKKKGLRAITLRPRALFGPGDTTIFPRVLEKLKSGKMMVIGDGKNQVDLTYIDNVVYSAILAAIAPSSHLGKKYNITNDEPVYFWDLIRILCNKLGLQFPSRSIPYTFAWYLAYIIELIWSLFGIKKDPPLSRYTVAIVGKSMTLDVSQAKTDLGYRPLISMQEGITRFLSWHARSQSSNKS